MSNEIGDIVSKTGNTFVQGFIGYVAANVVVAGSNITDSNYKTVAIVFLGSAIAAGICAVSHSIMNKLNATSQDVTTVDDATNALIKRIESAIENRS